MNAGSTMTLFLSGGGEAGPAVGNGRCASKDETDVPRMQSTSAIVFKKRRKLGFNARRRVSVLTRFIEFAFGSIPLTLTARLWLPNVFEMSHRDDNRFLRVDVTRGFWMLFGVSHVPNERDHRDTVSLNAGRNSRGEYHGDLVPISLMENGNA
jgi:hypothetical protein